VYIVLDFLEHDLQSLLQSLQDPFLPSEIKTIMLQITSATSYLHSNFILHRDLKTSNILLSNRGTIKLADFGMARYTSNPPPRLTQLVVTLWYRAPELLLGSLEYGSEIDIWSLGCIFAELLTLIPLFQGKNEVSHLSLIFILARLSITTQRKSSSSGVVERQINSIATQRLQIPILVDGWSSTNLVFAFNESILSSECR